MACLVPRIGFGRDLHRLQPGSGFRLGGVSIETDKSVVAHSDGDALLHALTDAVLGALAQGDIGDLFSDTDPRHEDRDSAEFLAAAMERVGEVGYAVGNVDLVISLEQPRLKPYKQGMRERIAQLLGADPEHVSVKAKTGEGVGPVGRGEAVAADAVVLLMPKKAA